MSFIGHHAIQGRLKNFLATPTHSKVFLFCGPKYSGKRTLASIFVTAYVNRSKELGSLPESIDDLGDIVEIFPEIEEKKGVVKEKQIDIDIVRKSIRAISLSSVHNGRKALLIDEAQKMTVQAQNAILKTLEEPVGNTLIILVAHTLDTLLPTILSRCEKEMFGTVSREDFYKSFSNIGFSDADRLWSLSLGLPGLAIQMSQNRHIFDERALIEKDTLRIEDMGIGERLRLGETLSKNIPKAIETLELWAFLFRERALLGKKEIRVMFTRVEKMHECIRLLKNTQVNSRLILENTLLNL